MDDEQEYLDGSPRGSVFRGMPVLLVVDDVPPSTSEETMRTVLEVFAPLVTRCDPWHDCVRVVFHTRGRRQSDPSAAIRSWHAHHGLHQPPILLHEQFNPFFPQGVVDYSPYSPTPLPIVASLMAACHDLPTWGASTTHDISVIYQYMLLLGGCTTNGRIYWREEEQHVLSIMLDGWFRPSIPECPNKGVAEKRCVLIGSPGVGKSTLLCVVAFYLALALTKAMPVAVAADATAIYYTLTSKHGRSNAWFLMDGFVYEESPPVLPTYRLFTTSQEVDLKSEIDYTYWWLFPSWQKADLFELGKAVHGMSEEEMTARTHFSGGNIRYFELPTGKDIQRAIDKEISLFADPNELFHVGGSLILRD